MKKLLLIIKENLLLKISCILWVIYSTLYGFIILWGEVLGDKQFDAYLDQRYVRLPLGIAKYGMSDGSLFIGSFVLKDDIFTGSLIGLSIFIILFAIWLIFKDYIKSSFRKFNEQDHQFREYSKRMLIGFKYSVTGWLIIGLLQIPFSLFKELDFVFGVLIYALTSLAGFFTLVFLFYLLRLLFHWVKIEINSNAI